MIRKVLVLVLLLAYLGGAALFLLHYRGYLRKPPEGEWNQAQAFLKGPGRYRGEPVLFTPSWLENYATDYSRFKGFNFEWSDSDPVYWHFSTREADRPGYQVVSRQEYKRLTLRKLVREGHESPAERGRAEGDTRQRPRRPEGPTRPKRLPRSND